MTENVQSKSVFLCGCGGGYDIYGSIPFYLKMKCDGTDDITLINYSFTERTILSKYGEKLTRLLFRIDPEKVSSLTDEIYFPELRLANELQIAVYAIVCNYQETTIELVVEAYQYLIGERVIDEVILVDCGSDVLLTGNEEGLGTPVEDMSHARAIHLLSTDQVKSKNIVVIGTNIDTGHGVLQSDLDGRLATLSSFAVFNWLWQYESDDDIRRYVDIVSRCNPQHSIVHSLVSAALQGQRGYYLPDHLRSRIQKSIVELSENTCLSIGYRLDDVMRDNIYFHRLSPEMNLKQVHETIYTTKAMRKSNEKVEKNTSSQRPKSNSQHSWFARFMLCLSSPTTRSSSPPKEDLQ